jgi:hypothetical protein
MTPNLELGFRPAPPARVPGNERAPAASQQCQDDLDSLLNLTLPSITADLVRKDRFIQLAP